MWTTVLVALALAHAGDGFTMFGFDVPPTPDVGSTVTLHAHYRLNRGEFIKKMKWYKDGDVFMSYAERPEKFLDWNPIPGVNIDQAASTHSSVVLTDVGDKASGQYTLEVQVHGPGGNVGNIVNGQYMNVGGVDTIGTRFGGGAGGVGAGNFFNFGSGFPFNNAGGTVFQSAGAGDLGTDTLGVRTSFQSASTGGAAGPGTTSIQSSSVGGAVGVPGATSFQSSSAGGNTAFQSSGPGGAFQSAGGAFQGAFPGNSFQSAGGAFQGSVPGASFQSSGGPGGAQSFQSFSGTGAGPLGVRSSFQSSSTGGEAGPGLGIQTAVADAQAQVQNAVNQINQLQAALANLGR